MVQKYTKNPKYAVNSDLVINGNSLVRMFSLPVEAANSVLKS